MPIPSPASMASCTVPAGTMRGHSTAAYTTARTSQRPCNAAPAAVESTWVGFRFAPRTPPPHPPPNLPTKLGPDRKLLHCACSVCVETSEWYLTIGSHFQRAPNKIKYVTRHSIERAHPASMRRLPPHSDANDTATVTTEGGPPERFSLTNGTIGGGDNAMHLRGQREPFYCICAESYFGHLCDMSLSPTSSPTTSPSAAPLAILRAYANTDDTTANQDLTWLWVLLALALVSAAAAYARRSRKRWRASKSAGVISTWNTKMSSFANPAFANSGSTAAPVQPSLHFLAWANETDAPPAEPTYAVPIEGGVGSSVLVARQPDGRPAIEGGVGSSVLVARQHDGRPAILNPTYAVPTENGGAPVLIAAPVHCANRMYTPADAQEATGYVTSRRPDGRPAILNPTYAVPTENGGAPVLIAAPVHCTNRMYTPADAQEATGYVIVFPAKEAVATESASTPPAVVAVPLHCINRMHTPADAQEAPGHDIPDGRRLLDTAPSAVQARNRITMPMGHRTRYAVPMEEHADGYMSVGGLEDMSGAINSAGSAAGHAAPMDAYAGPNIPGKRVTTSVILSESGDRGETLF